jgi:hypothetical protein
MIADTRRGGPDGTGRDAIRMRGLAGGDVAQVIFGWHDEVAAAFRAFRRGGPGSASNRPAARGWHGIGPTHRQTRTFRHLPRRPGRQTHA